MFQKEGYAYEDGSLAVMRDYMEIFYINDTTAIAAGAMIGPS